MEEKRYQRQAFQFTDSTYQITPLLWIQKKITHK